MERTILHCDCNSFFASVEGVLNPELQEYAFAVCGDPEYRHGIILAKNEKAKSFGVKTGEAIWQAKSKCPGLLTVKPHYKKYTEYSKRVFDIYCRYTDLVEPFGIDECWLDVSGTTHLFGSGREIADELRRVIKEETGLTVSVGVSYNKIFAKMLAKAFYDKKIDKFPFVLNSEQYILCFYSIPFSLYSSSSVKSPSS